MYEKTLWFLSCLQISELRKWSRAPLIIPTKSVKPSYCTYNTRSNLQTILFRPQNVIRGGLQFGPTQNTKLAFNSTHPPFQASQRLEFLCARQCWTNKMNKLGLSCAKLILSQASQLAHLAYILLFSYSLRLVLSTLIIKIKFR